jgi:O-methyltransferase involved in polyketide biosynthesis
MWISALPEDPEPWLAAYGWDATAVDARDCMRSHGRPAPPREQGSEPTWLIDATRSDSAAGGA